MKDLAIFCAGGFGREVACLVNKINEVKPTWNLVGFFDDTPTYKGTMISHYAPCLGGIDVLNDYPNELAVAICIGSTGGLKTIRNKIKNTNVYFPNIIAPNCQFFDEDSFSIGEGNIITFGCRMSCNIKIGNFNILNGCVSFGHDACIGDYNIMFPETRVSGQTVIGDSNFFAARCFVAQHLHIGNGNRFGAGTFVLRKIKDDGVYMGNPAKKVDID